MKVGDEIQENEAPEKAYKTIHNLTFTPVKGKTVFGGVFTDWRITYPNDYQL